METSDITFYNRAHLKFGSTSISRRNYVEEESLVEHIYEVYMEDMISSFKDSWQCSYDSYLEAIEWWSQMEGCVKIS